VSTHRLFISAASKNSDMHRLHHLEIGATWIAGGLLLATLGNAANNKITVTTPIQIAEELTVLYRDLQRGNSFAAESE
jgi:hypothetical protein